MAEEEDEHRKRLIDLHKARFGDVIPLIRREHVSGFYARNPVWLIGNLSLERIRNEASAMERQAEQFYQIAIDRDSSAIAAGQEMALERGMVIALEPKLIFPGQGVVGIENTHVVTKHGLERLTQFQDGIITL